jgi:hypothetical protein
MPGSCYGFEAMYSRYVGSTHGPYVLAHLERMPVA